ncbi:hypothetical protein ABKN59_011389 [Abortiporus biennis]
MLRTRTVHLSSIMNRPLATRVVLTRSTMLSLEITLKFFKGGHPPSSDFSFYVAQKSLRPYKTNAPSNFYNGLSEARNVVSTSFLQQLGPLSNRTLKKHNIEPRLKTTSVARRPFSEYRIISFPTLLISGLFFATISLALVGINLLRGHRHRHRTATSKSRQCH